MATHLGSGGGHRPGRGVLSVLIGLLLWSTVPVLLVDDPDQPGRLRPHRLASVAADGGLVPRGDADAAADRTPVRLEAAHVVGALWHLATVTLSSTAGSVLDVDGAAVASSATMVGGEAEEAPWRLGFDELSTEPWPARPASDHFAGWMAGASSWASVALPASLVAEHARAGRSRHRPVGAPATGIPGEGGIRGTLTGG
ncbi:hypothetical protein GB931_02320 [Modestobacter sp. I12A-02628]|uniref:Uncharacterized protein n=1 Tax=Goekera deserti TaxID=2497753 RepID=A0A7K3WFI5_9ACTN|nr:hypothetical protein [Goekera deserti]MPQ96774.1 hypothetical protein [Goekera deserti]NDI46912.1 hypothetical protein [Goekera deserti]NEL54480.1 hypothetical protein [Goekera deserti]